MSGIDFGGRNEWPFKDMAVGDVVCIDKSSSGKAQAYAHSYARQAGKKFSTKTDRISGNLYVKRIL